MKKIRIALLALIISTFTFSGVVFASFPVNEKSSKNEKTEIKNESTEKSSISDVQLSESSVSALKAKKEAKDSLPMDNEKLITLLLWFFLGAFAAHRWYRGKPAQWNILFILTAGGCGIWAIIDLINILTDKF